MIVAAGCGAKPPAPAPAQPIESVPLPPAARVHAGRNLYAVAVPRPAIDVARYTPEFHADLRWPLGGMSHPMLEPRFPIAARLADPGVSWQELCARGVQNRVSATQHELLAYLHGWCDVLKRDIDAACRRLTPLLGSLTGRMREAVRHDLANILVAQGDADKAEHWLSKYDIRDLEVLDLLAASYVEVGTPADALAIDRRAIGADYNATDATTCRRQVKRIVLSGTGDATFAIEALKQRATVPKMPDPTCVRLHNKIACWLAPQSACKAYLADQQLDPHALRLLDVYYAWPREADLQVWWDLGDRALAALPVPGAAELAVTAYEGSLRANGDCYGERADAIHAAIDLIRTDPANASYEPRLEALARACPKPALPGE